jgi:ATP-dependent DNA helicase DinG
MPLVARRARELAADLAYVGPAGLGAPAPAAREDVELEPEFAAEPEATDEPGKPVVWIEARERSVALSASPVDVGPLLRDVLFERTGTVVCTSATLATGTADLPSFHFARSRLGAPPETRELVVPSPFDFAACAGFYVSRDLPDPATPGYDEAALARALELIAVTGGGAFVLCTSNRAMQAFATGLKRFDRPELGAPRRPWKGPLLVQGTAPKHLLLARFRSAGDAVLVATMSFWEGVDVPGRALRLVILDKVPFAVPTDPLVVARCAAIERNGGNPFTEYTVPAAAITLKQGFGRLVRTQNDVGIVAVLDPRLASKGYGKRLAAGLPPAERLGTMEEVGEFWRKVGASESVGDGAREGRSVGEGERAG